MSAVRLSSVSGAGLVDFPSAGEARARAQITTWLLLCCALIFAMVVVGGITRLTHSGLSIAEWQPILGTLPPLSDADWERTFAKYRETPEYRHVNAGMSLDEFKGIFWWEYVHRLLGRAIGLVFLIPFIYFLLRRRLSAPLAGKLAGIFILGALQGALGWYMVKSGLVDVPRVSHLRLTAHLGLAVLIYAAILWTALDLLIPRERRLPDLRLRKLRRHAAALGCIVFVMILSGALVAGTRAGLAYNTFPLMNGYWMAPEVYTLEPWYHDALNNLATIQFNHRLIAWLLIALVPLFWLKVRRSDVPRRQLAASNMLLALLALQVVLGIATLLLHVPAALAAAHQAGALLLFSAILLVNHRLREPSA